MMVGNCQTLCVFLMSLAPIVRVYHPLIFTLIHPSRSCSVGDEPPPAAAGAEAELGAGHGLPHMRGAATLKVGAVRMR